MALSIVHRATGVALYFGTLLLAWWLIAAASGPTAYANVQAFTGSAIGKLIVFGYTWALMHHLCSGIRHFVWDLGYGFKANEREATDLGRAGRRHRADRTGLDHCLRGWRWTMSGPSSMRTPLERVRGLGSAHTGTGDFWRQRLTAVAMTLLIVPVIVVVIMLIGRNHAGAAQILGSIPIAIILLLFIVASTWHMKIGMQVVFEDYIHNEKLKIACVMANNFFCVAVALASIYAILKLSSGV
ncbi:succinate dehydrogenase cytochrome b556 subunit/succinate dehydrogenase hydrophobic membrane anchor protein [Bradyrhizobium sp. JR6.1]